MQQQDLIKVVKAIDDIRLMLYPLVEQTSPEFAPKAGARADWNGEVLKFTIPDVPPVLFSKYTNLSEHWLGMISHAFFEHEIEAIRFDAAFCLIVIKAPSKKIWDVDNRAIKPIIDGIRYLRIVPDDNWKHLTYMVTGKIDNGKPETEVYVTGWGNMVNLLVKLGVDSWAKHVRTI